MPAFPSREIRRVENVVERQRRASQSETYSRAGLDSRSFTDTGTETLAVAASNIWSLIAETDQFEITQSIANDTVNWGSWSISNSSEGTATGTGTMCWAEAFGVDDTGEDSLSEGDSDSIRMAPRTPGMSARTLRRTSATTSATQPAISTASPPTVWNLLISQRPSVG